MGTEHNNLPAEGKQSTVKELDLKELCFYFLDFWKLIFLCAVVCALLMAGYTHHYIPNSYSATSMLYVLNPTDSLLNLSDLQWGNYIAEDYLEVFKTHELNERVAAKLNKPYSDGQIRAMTKVSNAESTRILKITVTAGDPEDAALIANTVADVASDYIAETMITDRPSLLSSALVPKAPSGPNLMGNSILAAAAGMFVICAILTIRFLADDKIKTADEFTRITGLPVFAEIPVVRGDKTHTRGTYEVRD